ncbi:hypothetical protein CMUS01_07432 [Colletotrichum musicola]|uniref:SCA7 domain-containing protein n=1 Tax=Colletotrichum musicola TaxID=2175873 RepID=A0A8H6KHN6_9PEZI|nr:hypothetical protein CMUS01_07432 [Colletotrichum musicola]
MMQRLAGLNLDAGVLDVERQCGAAFPDGRLCGASLTCKRHSMSVKRAVAGRSAPYDTLLAAYQAERRSRAAADT